jgi:hypothetical protein
LLDSNADIAFDFDHEENKLDDHLEAMMADSKASQSSS